MSLLNRPQNLNANDFAIALDGLAYYLDYMEREGIRKNNPALWTEANAANKRLQGFAKWLGETQKGNAVIIERG